MIVAPPEADALDGPVSSRRTLGCRPPAFGFVAGLAAYLLWGLFPLYWPLLDPAGAGRDPRPPDRVVAGLRRARARPRRSASAGCATLGRRRARLLALAAVLITLNWGTLIYGVNSGHVVETSLGYFINPLVTVALAVCVLDERLRRAQWVAVAIGVVAVVVLTVDYGRPPWIALTLAFSFGLYGLIKKQAGVDGMQSLAFETALLAPPALAYLLWLGDDRRGHVHDRGRGPCGAAGGGGVVTAVPLMLFGAAAIRIPLSTLGLLQYLAPILQLAIGVVPAARRCPCRGWRVRARVGRADRVHGRRAARRPRLTAPRVAVAAEH